MMSAGGSVSGGGAAAWGQGGVVGGARFGIGERLVGFLDLQEEFHGPGVVAGIRVQPARCLVIGCPYLSHAGTLGYAQAGVVVIQVARGHLTCRKCKACAWEWALPIPGL